MELHPREEAAIPADVPREAETTRVQEAMGGDHSLQIGSAEGLFPVLGLASPRSTTLKKNPLCEQDHPSPEAIRNQVWED